MEFVGDNMIRIIDTCSQIDTLFENEIFNLEKWEVYINSIYDNAADIFKEDLKAGDIVEAGECIGTVAEPTKYYVVEGPNLYFQVVEGEASIDPTTLLQEERK